MQTVTQAASAAYYLGHMESHRSPFHYYNAGDEPDGKWWNPSRLFGLEDGEAIGAEQFQALYAGLSPHDRSPLTRNANRKGRSPGLDITFSADKSVSALWAIAPRELRAQIEACHHDAVRWTLESVTRAHCAYTRRGPGGAEVVSGDIFGTTFQHHTSRDGDPQLHTHCVLFNLVRTHDDGRWRTLHQRPIYQWVRAGGALYRHAIAWYLQERIGLAVERYGREDEYVRIAGLPEALLRAWSTRRDAIERLANKLGISTAETPTLSQQISLATRARKDPGDPDERECTLPRGGRSLRRSRCPHRRASVPFRHAPHPGADSGRAAPLQRDPRPADPGGSGVQRSPDTRTHRPGERVRGVTRGAQDHGHAGAAPQ